jgi:putative membrane protein
MRLLLRWITAAVGVGLAAFLVPGIHADGEILTLLGVALILGLVNALVRPLLVWLSCGVIALTLGLFIFVINALMLMLTAWIAGGLGLAFQVDGFIPALLGSLVISVLSIVASLVLPDRRSRRR